jgi:DNA-binding MltR family transcriptional regulator
MAPRPPLPPEVLSSDTEKFFKLLNESQDSSLIVVAVSYIDACLASLLAKRLRKSSISESLLDSRAGPMGSFAVRSKLAYALALIDKPMYQDLQLLSELRNEVAHHHFELQIADPAVAAACMKLGYVSSLNNGLSDKPLMDDSWLASPRSRFTISAMLIAQRLLLTALGTKHLSE